MNRGNSRSRKVEARLTFVLMAQNLLTGLSWIRLFSSQALLVQRPICPEEHWLKGVHASDRPSRSPIRRSERSGSCTCRNRIPPARRLPKAFRDRCGVVLPPPRASRAPILIEGRSIGAERGESSGFSNAVHADNGFGAATVKRLGISARV